MTPDIEPESEHRNDCKHTIGAWCPPSWVAVPIEGLEMQRFNPWFFYSLGRRMEALRHVTEEDFVTHAFDAYAMPAELTLMQLESQMGRNLTQSTKDSITMVRSMMDLQDPLGVRGMLSNLNEFETLLGSDCQDMNLFLVHGKYGYDLNVLIERGEELIDEKVRMYLSKIALSDIGAGTRCLAFELGTACVFHFVRATEEVMRLYHRKFVGPLPEEPKDQTMGALYKVLKEHDPASAIVGDVKHIKDHYRNPTAHPDVTYAPGEANSAMRSCLGAIEKMLQAVEAEPSPPKDPDLVFPWTPS